MKYKAGETAYIIENNCRVVEVTVKSFAAGFYIVQPVGTQKGIRLREGRLFSTLEEAKTTISHQAPSSPHLYR